jgi:hypothetical protein
MITKGLFAASAAAAMLGATVIVTAAPANADEQFWGAIAYSPLDGAAGKSSQQPKESDARKAAIIDCGDNGGSGCEIVVTVQRPDCASLVGNDSLYSWGVAQLPAAAKKSALADLGEPGSELISTCGFIAGAVPAPTTQAPTAPGPIAPAPTPLPPTAGR